MLSGSQAPSERCLKHGKMVKLRSVIAQVVSYELGRTADPTESVIATRKHTQEGHTRRESTIEQF